MKSPKHVHILAICGYSTSGLALMAKRMGYFVTGSDEDAYPPVSILVTRAKIPWHNFHSAQNLKKWGLPDLVIQGNQVRQGNPELLAARRLGLKIVSDSEFFYQLTKDRRRIVVTGTHGKTTIGALVTWILAVDRRQPGYRLGTITKNFKRSVELGRGREFVFEGDEYTTSCDDDRPKFFHFRPQLAIINNIEWDHPDVFKTPRIYVDLFRQYLVNQMPKDGWLIFNQEDKNASLLAKQSPCRTFSFGLKVGQLQAKNVEFGQTETVFDVYLKGEFFGHFTTSLPGYHNVKNCLAALAVGLILKVPVKNLKKALRSFEGTSRRFEQVGVARGITIIDDYAHHPTKVRETVEAAKARYPKSRIWVVYVPHTYSRTKALFKEYLRVFTEADFLVLPDIEPARERHLEKLIHSKHLVEALNRRQKNVFYLPRQEDVINLIASKARSGDVVLCMSVRGFDNLARKLVKRLRN